MINATFAQNFIHKVNRQLDFKVNIMNEKGIIIASSAPERIGDFHIIAYEIIQKKQLIHSTEVPSEGMIGLKSPGVNLLLMDGIEAIGVVGVSGDPKEVTSVAKTIKFALESMLEYQGQYMETYQSTKESNKLTHALLMETPVVPSRILHIASQLGIKNKCTRLPLFVTVSGRDAQNCINVLLEKFHHEPDSQDVLLPLDSERLLYLTTIPDIYQSEYDTYVADLYQEFAQHLAAKMAGGEFQLRFLCGIPQFTLLDCRKAYESLAWLKNREESRNYEILYLRDYILEYLVEHTDTATLTPFFEYYYQLLEKNTDLSMFRDTVGAMIETNMKPEDAAGILYMHRNTVVARIKKIKEILGIQPMSKTKDALFLIALFQYSVSHNR